MWKILIADDEPKIRKGLRNSLDWAGMDAEIVGEAEDGEIALEMVRATQPDILLLDICMPFINGIELIEKLKMEYSDCVIIVITGHDEFAYAREALRLRVFDYVLKPVLKEQLQTVILKAINELSDIRKKNKYFDWAKTQLSMNFNILKERFMNDWVENHITKIEIDEQIKYFNIELCENCGMILIKPIERYNVMEEKQWDRNLLIFAIQNVIEELIEDLKPGIVFKDNKDNIIAITAIHQVSEWMKLKDKFENYIEKYLDNSIRIYQKVVENGTADIPNVYGALLEESRRDSNYTPMVTKAKQYIEKNFFKEELSLEEVSSEIKVSPAYLSRVLKQETGSSFIDYLTQVRVKMAIQLMSDPAMKIYEIAEKTGYNSQHYFSTAFKRVLGVSPVEYKKANKCPPSI